MEPGTTETSSRFLLFSDDKVSEKWRKKAEKELNEREVQKSLALLKKLLKKESNLNPCLDEEFLIQFLRARKYNCERTVKLIKNYYSARLNYPDMFKNFTPKSCMKILQKNLHYLLPYRSPDGCAIMLSKIGQWDPEQMSLGEILKFSMVCTEMAVQNHVTQICGIITIVDLKGITFKHAQSVKLSDVRCYVNSQQDVLPVRNKASHIVNVPEVFAAIFALVKPLIKTKTLKRIYCHGKDLKRLHEHLPPEILPEDLGGKLRIQPNEDFYSSLLDSEELFLSRQRYGYLQEE